MNDKVGAFCKLMESNHLRYLRWVRDTTVGPKLVELNGVVNRAYNVVETRELEQVLTKVKTKGKMEFPRSRAFLFLEPPDKEAVLPVLSATGDFNENKLSVRMALFTLDEWAKPAAVGFRFETPHGKRRHNYHHVQMIRTFDKDIELPQAPPWLPVTQPALMMSATNPLTLFLGVLISLYGFEGLERNLKGQGFNQSLKDELDELKKACGHI